MAVHFAPRRSRSARRSDPPMPTYEYKCEACGNQFEKFQSITAAPIKKCPNCGKKRVKRLIGTGAGLIFKGGGFYETDYRSEAYKSAAKADTASAPATKESTSSNTGGGDSAAKSTTDSKSAPAAKPAAEAKSPAAPTKKASKSSK
jgi:putative FmdB family regulatory protein